MKECVLDYQVYSGSRKNIIEEIHIALQAEHQGCKWLACINPHSYTIALQDDKFRAALVDADWLMPDGVGIIVASKLLGGKIRSRVTGSDIFFALNRYLNKVGGFSIFILGSTELTLDIMNKNIARDFPSIRVAGTCSPPFKREYTDTETDEMISVINDSGADILWVGLTAPKQEKWIYQNKSKLDVKFAAGIGAVFDFYAGNVKRSAPIFQAWGLEWLPRLLQQPKRLWRRTLISAPIFLFHVLAYKRRKRC